MKLFFRRIALFIAIAIVPVGAMAEKTLRVEPPCWWTGMKTPLTLLVHGEGLKGSDVSVNSENISIVKVQNADSPNYLFIDIGISEKLAAGQYVFTITRKDGSRISFDYTFENRKKGSANRAGFGAADVVYLLMPDRFANGDRRNDSSPGTAEKGDRNNPVGRHGGDLQGVMDHLDYLSDLGITAIWPTPITLDNEPVYSYHGYACADYYKIDPRYGSNELYRKLVAKAKEKGIKFIQDIVPNHCGTAHWWMRDLPFADWINVHDTFTRSNHSMSTQSDPHASISDKETFVTGWFDNTMPDMNLNNPFCLKYFTQLAIWWTEYADLSGLRVDTFPYSDKYAISKWTAAILNEFPNLTIVGECWFRNPGQIAYWEGREQYDGYNSHLPMVMDFCLMEKITESFMENEDIAWNEGIKKVYNSISMDFVYGNPYNILTFITNHDMERPAVRFGAYRDDESKVIARMKNALTLILTARGCPQLYYGDEILMRCPEDRIDSGDTWWRTDFPGGWKGDTADAFTAEGRTPEQNDIFNFTKNLLNWRKNAEAVRSGKMLHFLPDGELLNTYVYFRYTEDYKNITMIAVNNGAGDVKIDFGKYEEILTPAKVNGTDTSEAVNILTGKKVSLEESYILKGMSSIVLEF